MSTQLRRVLIAVCIVLVGAGTSFAIVSSQLGDTPKAASTTTPIKMTPTVDPKAQAAARLAELQTSMAPLLARLHDFAKRAPSLSPKRLSEPLDLKSLREDNNGDSIDAYVIGDDVPIDQPASSWTDRFWMNGPFANAFDLLAGKAHPHGFELEMAAEKLQRLEYVLILHLRERYESKILSEKTFSPGYIHADVRIFRMRDGAYVGGIAFAARSSERVMVADTLTDFDDDLRLQVRTQLHDLLLHPPTPPPRSLATPASEGSSDAR
jgi:hypothetical protein